MKMVMVFGGFVAAVVVAGWLYLAFGNSRGAVTKLETGLFKAESDAAYVTSTTIKTEPPIAMLAQGQQVAVLWNTHGKDYWACYVRSTSGQRGWILCTSLENP
jgi:hypothetical protein